MSVHLSRPAAPSSALRPLVVDAVLDALAVLLPVECAGCGSPDRALCAGCRSALSPHPTRATLPGLLPATAALDYDGVVRSVVLACKDHDRPGLARALAPALGAAVAAAQDESGPDLLPVLVPSSRASRRRRGYDPVAEIARAARLRPVRALALRGSAVQKALSASEREEARIGTMTCSPRVAGRRILLLDDVVTTGATLVEAARAVHAAGGEPVAAAVVAITRRRHGESSVATR